MTISYKVGPGQIWLAYLYFIDHPEIGKVKPVLIVDIDDNMLSVLALKITSKETVDFKCFPISGWRECGLRKPSYIRADTVFRIEISELLRDTPIGVLDKKTFSDVMRKVSELAK